MPSKKQPITQFLNVDLDVCVRSGLENLIEAMSPHVVILHQTKETASLELSEETPNLDEAIIRFAQLIAALPPQAKNIWNQCERRSMNIGIQAGLEPRSAAFLLSSKAVSALTDIRSEIVFTVYA